MPNDATSKEEYIQLFNEIIHQQSIVLGPDIAIVIARKVDGLVFSDDGKITDFSGNSRETLQSLIDGFVNLSGMIVRKTIEPLLAKYPGANSEFHYAHDGVEQSAPSTVAQQKSDTSVDLPQKGNI